MKARIKSKYARNTIFESFRNPNATKIRQDPSDTEALYPKEVFEIVKYDQHLLVYGSDHRS
jgi:hypothetical protein